MERNIKGNRIVIKIGTSSLINPNGSLNRDSIQKLSDVLCELKMQGKEVVLVSSGAIGVGMGRLGLKDRPTTISGQQAVAAVGQGELLSLIHI